MYDLNELNRIAAEYGAQVQIDPHEYEMATIISVRLGNKVADAKIKNDLLAWKMAKDNTWLQGLVLDMVNRLWRDKVERTVRPRPASTCLVPAGLWSTASMCMSGC